MIMLFILNMELEKLLQLKKAVIGDIDINYYKILIERDKLTLTIPINQQSFKTYMFN